MQNEIEFFGTNQKDAFLSMVNNVVKCYNQLGGNLELYRDDMDFWRSKKNPNSVLIELMNKCGVIIFHRGDPVSIPVFLKRVATGKIVGLGKPDGNAFASLEETFLGFGHFRNGIAYTLDEMELKALRKYLSGSFSDFATTSFKYKNLIISSKLAKQGVTFPNSEHEGLHNQFNISVLNNDTNSMISFDYYGSTNDYNNGELEIKGEDLLQAFECFIIDGVYAEQDFEEWCSEFGYDSDSRKHEKIYKECQKSLAKARVIIDGDIWEFSNELNELINQ